MSKIVSIINKHIEEGTSVHLNRTLRPIDFGPVFFQCYRYNIGALKGSYDDHNYIVEGWKKASELDRVLDSLSGLKNPIVNSKLRVSLKPFVEEKTTDKPTVFCVLFDGFDLELFDDNDKVHYKKAVTSGDILFLPKGRKYKIQGSGIISIMYCELG